MHKQSYSQYLFTRIEFSLAVGLLMEFDYEANLRSSFPEPVCEEDCKELSKKVMKFEFAETTEDLKRKGEVSFPCMKYAGILKLKPALVAERLAPYLEWMELEKTEVVGGYLNIFFDKGKFLKVVI